MANRLAQEIERILSDELGEFIGQATMKKNCELIGTSPDKLRDTHLAELSVLIEKSMNFFSGKDKGAMVATRVRSIQV